MKATLQRTSWIDIARGIGILLVLYGHVLGSEKSRFFIYSFHMPLFFFVSGLVFKEKHVVSFSHFLKKDIKQIILPYIFFSLITYCYWYFFIEPTTKHATLDSLMGIIYGNGIYPSLEFNAPLWFLPCFFATRLLYGILIKFVKSTQFRFIVLMLLGLLGFILAQFFPEAKMPFSLEVALTCVVFFGLGHIFQEKIIAKSVALKNVLLLILIVCTLLLTYLFASWNFQISHHQIDMRINQFNNIFYFYVAAISGIAMVIFTSLFIRKNRLIQYIGQKTFLLFAWHYPIYLTLNKVLDSQAWTHNDTLKLFFPISYTLFALFIILCLDLIRQVRGNNQQ